MVGIINGHLIKVQINQEQYEYYAGSLGGEDPNVETTGNWRKAKRRSSTLNCEF